MEMVKEFKMKKLFVLVFVAYFLFQTAFLERAEAGSGKLLLGIGLTAGGVIGILVGRKEVEVLDKEYDFTTYAYMAVWDDIGSAWISEVWDYEIDRNPETIVEKDKVIEGWAYGTNDYDIYMYAKYNHHKEYKTEKRTNTLGYMGYMATGVGVTLIIDYLLEKTEFTKRTGLEIKTVTKLGYCEFALAKRF